MRFKGGRFTIMGRMRAVGDNCLDRRRGIFFHPGIVRRGGTFSAAGVELGGKGVSTPPLSAPLSIDIRGYAGRTLLIEVIK